MLKFGCGDWCTDKPGSDWCEFRDRREQSGRNDGEATERRPLTSTSTNWKKDERDSRLKNAEASAAAHCASLDTNVLGSIKNLHVCHDFLWSHSSRLLSEYCRFDPLSARVLSLLRHFVLKGTSWLKQQFHASVSTLVTTDVSEHVMKPLCVCLCVCEDPLEVVFVLQVEHQAVSAQVHFVLGLRHLQVKQRESERDWAQVDTMGTLSELQHWADSLRPVQHHCRKHTAPAERLVWTEPTSSREVRNKELGHSTSLTGSRQTVSTLINFISRFSSCRNNFNTTLLTKIWDTVKWAVNHFKPTEYFLIFALFETTVECV